jgi:hypothetical protein
MGGSHSNISLQIKVAKLLGLWLMAIAIAKTKQNKNTREEWKELHRPATTTTLYKNKRNLNFSFQLLSGANDSGRVYHVRWRFLRLHS